MKSNEPWQSDISGRMQSPPGPEVLIDGARYLYFGGTSYLGLAGRPEVIEAGCEAMRRYGVHSATSRAGYGTNPPVREVEQRAAEFFDTEDAFYFSSGYAANHIMVADLAPDVDCVFVESSAHYCVHEAARLAGKPVQSFQNSDLEDLAQRATAARRVLVMADAVGSATGSTAPVAEYLRALRKCAHAILLLDDAHGFGVLGEHGRGLLEEVGLWDHANNSLSERSIPLCVCGTLAKALGGFGGIIPGSAAFVERARKASHYFDGASAPPSAVAGATAKALEIVMREPALRVRLRENTLQLREGLRGLGLDVPHGVTAHFGMQIGDQKNMGRIHEHLKGRGILLPYLGAYTGVAPDGLLRFAVFANHTEEQINRLIAAMGEAL